MRHDLFVLAPRFTRKQQLWLISLTALGFLLRLYRLDMQSLWFDETLSTLFASQPLDIAIQSMLQEGLQHSPMYYLLLRPFATGNLNEFSLRFLSVVMGVLSVPLMAQLGRVLIGNRYAILATLLLVINPFHVWYSQETRMYATLVVAALGAMLFFARNLRWPHWRNWLGLGVFSAIGFNTHHFFFFIPLVQFIFIINTLKQNYGLLRPWAGTYLLAGLSFLPWLIIVLNWGSFYLSSGTQLAPTWYSLAQTFWNFSLGYTEQITFFVLVTLGLFMLLFGLGIISVGQIPGAQLLVWWAVVPPVMTFLMSFRLPMYLDRYLSLSLPPFLLLITIGGCCVRSRQLQLIAMGFILAVMMGGLGRVYYDTNVYNRADWRSLGAYLEANAKSGDVIALRNYQTLIPVFVYYQGAVPLKPAVIFDKVNLPELPSSRSGSQKLWFIVDYPNNSAHLVGHCQSFNIQALALPPALVKWRARNQDSLIGVKEFSCLRLEIYE